MVYLALINNFFKALKLFLNKYVLYYKSSCLAMAFGHPPYHNTEFWHGLALVINITSCKKQMQLLLTYSCLQMSIFAQTLV